MPSVKEQQRRFSLGKFYINSKIYDPNRIWFRYINLCILILCHLLIYYIWINTAITRSTSHNESASPIGGSASAGYDNPTFRRGFSFTSSAPFSYLTGGNPNSRYRYNKALITTAIKVLIQFKNRIHALRIVWIILETMLMESCIEGLLPVLILLWGMKRMWLRISLLKDLKRI